MRNEEVISSCEGAGASRGSEADELREGSGLLLLLWLGLVLSALFGAGISSSTSFALDFRDRFTRRGRSCGYITS